MGSWRLSDTNGLRLLEPGDAEELQALIVANREHLTRWLPWAAAQTPAETSAFIRRSSATGWRRSARGGER